MIYISDEIKRLNIKTLLRCLYMIKSATMAELQTASGLSQSSVRSILLELIEQKRVELASIDPSSGGRKAGRYVLRDSAFRILSVFFGIDFIKIRISDINDTTLCRGEILNKDGLIDKLLPLLNQYQVACVSFGVNGIVDGTDFHSDASGTLEKFDYVTQFIKRAPHVAVVVENDVKAMAKGYQKEHPNENIAYLHLDVSGLGSAFLINNHILRGEHQLSGEFGLLPFHGKTINQWLHNELNDEEYIELCSYILMSVACFVDPASIVLTGNCMRLGLNNQVLNECQQGLQQQFQAHVTYRYDQSEDALEGLHAFGVESLLDI